MKRGDSVQFGSGCRRGVVAVRGLFSLDGFLPDVAEGGVACSRTGSRRARAGWGEPGSLMWVRDARVGREGGKP